LTRLTISSICCDRSVDVVNHGAINGTKLLIWDCTGQGNQKWRLG
jgi:hypothetical protein